MNRTTRLALIASTIAGAALAAPLAAQAAMLAALEGDNTLTMIDTATLKAGKSMAKISAKAMTWPKWKRSMEVMGRFFLF